MAEMKFPKMRTHTTKVHGMGISIYKKKFGELKSYIMEVVLHGTTPIVSNPRLHKPHLPNPVV
jgi:hypothetical protein